MYTGTPESLRKLDPNKLREACDALFVFALTYSVGGTARTAGGRAAVAGFIKAMVTHTLDTYVSPAGE